MRPNGILGIVLLCVGIILLVFAWRAANAPVDQVVDTLTGRFTQGTMLYIIGGVIALVLGVVLLVARPRP
jgi:uncharacterized membrane protein HdeD (DUF308 family)